MRRFDSDSDFDYDNYGCDYDNYGLDYLDHDREENKGLGFLEFAFLKELFGFRKQSGVVEDYILYKIFGKFFILWELLGLGRRNK